jgi:hypothetical protein
MSAVSVYDNFVGSSGVNLNTLSGWSKYTQATTGNVLLDGSNGIYPSQAGSYYYINSWVPPTANYVVKAEYYYYSSLFGSQMSICGRMSNVADSFYYAFWDDGTPGFYIQKYVAGAFANLGSYGTSLTVGTAHIVELSMIGSSISLSLDGSIIISVTDSSITAAGSAGIGGQAAMTASTGMHARKWYAGASNVGSMLQAGY